MTIGTVAKGSGDRRRNVTRSIVATGNEETGVTAIRRGDIEC